MSQATPPVVPDDPDVKEFYERFINDKSVKDIETVIKDLNSVKDSKRKDSYIALYQEFDQKVVSIGFANLRDFITAIEVQGIIKPARSPRRKVDIRFRDPENPNNTWTGRGKQPTWMKLHINNGRTQNEFLVAPDIE